ncbi:Phosphatidylinositol transfer protein (PITP) [Rhizina undulata]
MSTPAVEQPPVPTETEKSSPPTTTTTTATTPTTTPTTTRITESATYAAREATTGKKLVPFLHPDPSCVPSPPAPLTPEQQTKYEELLAHVQSLTTIPTNSTKTSSTRDLSESERLWLTRECLLRYLRASKWSLPDSKKRIEATLIWRREYGVEDHTPEYISPENETGKQVILGYDNNSRPCLYLNPAKQNTEKSPRQIQHLVFMLERVIDLLPAGQETLALLVDFKSSTNSSNPSVGQGREVMNILQMHYPERLGRAFVVNIPLLVWGFLKLINPFIDPLTREKLVFNEDLRKHVPAPQLDKKFGGDVDFDYDHAVYWPELNRLASESRAAYVARWKQSGAQIGASEVELRKGLLDGLGEAFEKLEFVDV